MSQIADEDQLKQLVKMKYRKVFSIRLDKYVYVLRNWVDRSVFKGNKKLFGYTDIGWTVKHPLELTKIMLELGHWDLAELEQEV